MIEKKCSKISTKLMELCVDMEGPSGFLTIIFAVPALVKWYCSIIFIIFACMYLLEHVFSVKGCYYSATRSFIDRKVYICQRSSIFIRLNKVKDVEPEWGCRIIANYQDDKRFFEQYFREHPNLKYVTKTHDSYIELIKKCGAIGSLIKGDVSKESVDRMVKDLDQPECNHCERKNRCPRYNNKDTGAYYICSFNFNNL